MAPLPLAYQPGEGWVYSVSVDIQGYLVEKLSGQPFAEFLRERIFEPLGMNDTAFFVPREQAVAARDDLSADGATGPGADAARSEREHAAGIPSGGGGLYSTDGDYLRFAQMLAQPRRARRRAHSRAELGRTDDAATTCRRQ